jgi:hypothetical protein
MVTFLTSLGVSTGVKAVLFHKWSVSVPLMLDPAAYRAAIDPLAIAPALEKSVTDDAYVSLVDCPCPVMNPEAVRESPFGFP